MTFSILKNNNFRNFFLADIISGFGSGMSFIGASWFILEKTGSNSSVGFLLALTLFAGLLTFPFSGTIADRFNRRQIIWWSNIARGALIVLVAITILTSTFNLAFLYFLAIVAGIGWSIFVPASRGLVQEIVPHEELMKGNSLIEISMQAGMFTAAAVCGIIYKYAGFSAILFIDAVTFFASNIFLAKIKYDAVAVHDSGEEFGTQFTNGLQFLIHNKYIFGFGIMMFLPFVATMTSNVVLPGYVSGYLHKDSVVFGLADMSYGIGACLSGFIAALLAAKFTRHRTVLLFFIASIASLIYLIFNAHVAGLYIASIIFGLANSSLRILLQTTAMELTPKEFFGRSMSVWMAFSMAMQVAATYGIGRLMDSTPANLGFLWLAVIMIVGLLLYLVLKYR